MELRVGMEHKVKEIREEAEKYAVNTIEELEGFANRRKYLPSLPRWTENERAAIIHKKTEMQNVKRKRK